MTLCGIKAFGGGVDGFCTAFLCAAEDAEFGNWGEETADDRVVDYVFDWGGFAGGVVGESVGGG